MTAPDTAAIRERLEKATKGHGDKWEWIPVSEEANGLFSPVGNGPPWWTGHIVGKDDTQNAIGEFCAHAPADIAALLAENERLRIRVDEAERAWRAHRDSALRWEKLYRDATGDPVQEPDNDNIKF